MPCSSPGSGTSATVNPQNAMVTGLTRDGVWLIENGKVVHPVNNFRFNDSPVNLLKNLEATSVAVPAGSEFFAMHRPGDPRPRLPLHLEERRGLRHRGDGRSRACKVGAVLRRPEGSQEPSPGFNPGDRPPHTSSCALKGCRRGLLRPFRPPETGYAVAPRVSPGAVLLRPFRPPEMSCHCVCKPTVSVLEHTLHLGEPLEERGILPARAIVLVGDAFQQLRRPARRTGRRPAC